MSGALVDTMINEEIIPPQALKKAKQLYREAHGQFHRGHFMDAYTQYVDGLADGMEVSSADLQEFIAGIS